MQSSAAMPTAHRSLGRIISAPHTAPQWPNKLTLRMPATVTPPAPAPRRGCSGPAPGHPGRWGTRRQLALAVASADHLPVTLTQLSAFILVARLGSVKDAAKVLGVSEPAVSQAIAALRQHLDDQLVSRSGS